jgi:hypothetical protein
LINVRLDRLAEVVWMRPDLLFGQRGERLSKVILFQITVMMDNDVQRAKQAFDWTSQYVEQHENRFAKGKRVKMEMLADVKQTLLEDRKRSGGPERLYRRWPFSCPREEKRWWGNGSGRPEAQTKRAGRGRQLPRPIIPDTSRSSKAHFPFITTYHHLGLHVAQSKASSCSMTAA